MSTKITLNDIDILIPHARQLARTQGPLVRVPVLL